LALNLVGQTLPYEFEGTEATELWPFWVAGLGETRPVSTTFTNVVIRGDKGEESDYSYNTRGAISLRNLSGVHAVSRSTFGTIGGAVIDLVRPASATVTLGGPTEEDLVTCTDVSNGILNRDGAESIAVEVSHVNATDVSARFVTMYRANASSLHISNLKIVNGGGLFIEPCPMEYWMGNTVTAGCATEPWSLLFENNDILGQGLEIWENGESEIVIRDNVFHGIGTYQFGPIWTCGTRNAQITSNTFVGSGPGAIHVGMGTCGGDEGGMMITDNDFTGWTQDAGEFEPGWHGQAPIWLGSKTLGVTVSGCGDPKVVVYDESDKINTPEYDGNNNIEGL
jgi:hypothetical protein